MILEEQKLNVIIAIISLSFSLLSPHSLPSPSAEYYHLYHTPISTWGQVGDRLGTVWGREGI
jgi:hypothetical protein